MVQAGPQRPIDPALELAHDLPPYRASLEGGARDLSGAMLKAHSLIDEGRRRADIRPFAYAERLLTPYADQISRNTELALLIADIQQYRHNFDGAAALLDQILTRDPRNSNARLMRAQIRLVQGRGPDAVRDCMSLVGREAAWIWSACSAQALAINGRLPDAQRLLEASLRGNSIEGTAGAWVAGIMAELSLQNGDRATAETWLQRAIESDPFDHVAAIELIDLWNDSGRSAKSLEFMRYRPVSDAYLIRKAIALQILGDPQSKAVVAELKRRFVEADELGDRTHLRERAAFELQFGDSQAALANAQENFRTQRALVDLRLLLKCAVAAHAKSGANDALQWLGDSHAQDKRLESELALLSSSP
jgi:tetratricopeptide (TPR) repeat protein